MTGRLAARAARSAWRCTVGTRSGGSSTPRSPRATVMASARATISSRRSTAAGFSSLATSATRRFPASALTSSRSSGRWTKESATQSTPAPSANARSSRSFAVRAESGSTTPGTFTPLRSDSGPPVTTLVSAKPSPQRSTASRSLPSSSRSSAPGRSAAKISGCGSRTRSRSPGASSRSSRNGRPASGATGPPAKVPMRSFGPCRSARTPIGRPACRSTSRMVPGRAWWSAWEPWLKSRRNTSAPASNRDRTASSDELAGPRVATILALRLRRMALHQRLSAAPTLGVATGPAAAAAARRTICARGRRARRSAWRGR